jgi:hypothetical protein
MYVLTKYTLSAVLTTLEFLTPRTLINLFSVTKPSKCTFYTLVQSYCHNTQNTNPGHYHKKSSCPLFMHLH